MKSENKKNHLLNKQGFTLLEVLVSLFIFTLVMVAISGILASFIAGFRQTKILQRNLENAQYSMNLVSKILRTSTVTSTAGLPNSITVFDNSQEECIVYTFGTINGLNSLNFSSKNAAQSSDCSSGGYSSPIAITTTPAEGSFLYVKPTSSTELGIVTIKMEVGSGTDKMRVQTTVSLRDYSQLQ